MNPQKNQEGDSALLRDIQSEVAAESAPLLQFILRHGGAIAGFVFLFVLILAGTGLWRWHVTGQNEDARQDLARILQQPADAAQIKALADLAGRAPEDSRCAVLLSLGVAALKQGDTAAAADAFAKAAKDDKGAMGRAAAVDQAGALLAAGKAAEALPLLQGALAGAANAPQLAQMTAEAAAAAGQKESAARLYLALARNTSGIEADYLRARAAALAPELAAAEGKKADNPQEGSVRP